MKKWQIGLVISGVLLVLFSCGAWNLGSWGIKTSNQIQTSDQARKAQWANVQTAYQKRYDLLNNLASSVKGYAKHEFDTKVGWADARSKAGGVLQIDPQKMAETMKDPQQFAAFEQAQGQLGATISRLMMLRETDPALKADVLFTKFMDSNTDIESEIQFERRKYTDKVQDENNLIKNLPSSIVAQFEGYKELPYFASASGAEKAPVVDFNK